MFGCYIKQFGCYVKLQDISRGVVFAARCEGHLKPYVTRESNAEKLPARLRVWDTEQNRIYLANSFSFLF